jgi:hypothetical protein
VSDKLVSLESALDWGIAYILMALLTVKQLKFALPESDLPSRLQSQRPSSR